MTDVFEMGRVGYMSWATAKYHMLLSMLCFAFAFAVWRLSPTDRLAWGTIISGSTAPVVCLVSFFLGLFFTPLTAEALNPSGLSQHPASCLHVASVHGFDLNVKHTVKNNTFSSNATFVSLNSCFSCSVHTVLLVQHAHFSSFLKR